MHKCFHDIMFGTLFRVYLRSIYGNNFKSFEMKKLFSIVMILASVMMLATSCNKKSKEPMYVSIATLVEGSALTGGGVYVVFDNGKTASVSNPDDVKVEPVVDNEVRAMIYYTIDDAEATGTGYDMVITINSGYTLITDYVRFIEDHEIGGVETYTDGLDVVDGYYANNWITVNLTLPATQSKEHKLYLVYNDRTDHSGLFQDLYSNDGYLYLELYYDNEKDGGNVAANAMTGYICWKVRSNLGVNLNDYNGIKILYWDYKNNRADVCTIEKPDFNSLTVVQ